MAVCDDGHRLRRRGEIDAQEHREVLAGRDVRGLHLVGRVQPLREGRGARHAAGDLEVRRIVAALAGDERVFPGARGGEVIDRVTPSHHARLCLDCLDVEATALEDSVVCPGVRLERCVEPFLVAIERVRVLHHELADAEKASTGPGLVALLRLEVVEDLRQVAVRAQLARVERDRLLVRQRRGRTRAPSCRGAS